MPSSNLRPKNKINKQKEFEKQRRKKKKNRLIKTIIIIVIVGFLTYLYTSPVFKIKNIIIKGNSQISTQKVIEMSGLNIGDNIFLELGIVTKVKLKQFGYIKEAEIHKRYPNEVEITIEERNKQYQIQTDNNTYIYIDEQGYILESSKDKLELPVIIGMELTEEEVPQQRRLNDKDLEKMENVLQIREQFKKIGMAEKITQIQLKNEYIISLEEEGISINLGNATDLKNKMDYVAALMKKEEGNKGTIYVNGNLNDGFFPYFSAD